MTVLPSLSAEQVGHLARACAFLAAEGKLTASAITDAGIRASRGEKFSSPEEVVVAPTVENPAVDEPEPLIVTPTTPPPAHEPQPEPLPPVVNLAEHRRSLVTSYFGLGAS